MALYNAAGGPGWTNNSNWLSNEPIGNWHGVTTEGGRVAGLFLNNNNLSGNIPPELGNLASLTQLYIGNNNLSGNIPPEMGNLANLREMHLINNNLSGNIPPEMGNLANLRRLHLGNNNLSGNIPLELGNLANLTTLWLSDNGFTGCLPSGLKDTTNNDLSQINLPFCSDDTPTPAPPTDTPTAAPDTPTPAPPTNTPTAVPDTPTPAATATPAPTPPFRVGPTVRLRPVNDVIDADSDGLVEVLLRNPAVNDTIMVADLTVSIPTGFHLYGEGFATDTAAGAASGSFETPPGQSRTIFLNIKAERPGRANIHFSGLYWPKGNKDLFNPVSLTYPFTVTAASRDPFSEPGAGASAAVPPATAPGAQPPVQESAPGVSCSLSPKGGYGGAGDMALLGLPLLGLAGLALRRPERAGAVIHPRNRVRRFPVVPVFAGKTGWVVSPLCRFAYRISIPPRQVPIAERLPQSNGNLAARSAEYREAVYPGERGNEGRLCDRQDAGKPSRNSVPAGMRTHHVPMPGPTPAPACSAAGGPIPVGPSSGYRYNGPVNDFHIRRQNFFSRIEHILYVQVGGDSQGVQGLPLAVSPSRASRQGLNPRTPPPVILQLKVCFEQV